MRKSHFYTYAQAKAVVAEMGITGVNDYLARRSEDPRLPSDPYSYYRGEWESWPVFLGKPKKPAFYSYEEAQTVVAKMGITGVNDYRARRKEDPRLPSQPERSYKDQWKSWPVFLGKPSFYTYAQAKAVVAEMGITGVNDYRARRKEDPRLPSNPHVYYRDEWKSWPVFLGKPSFYTYAQAKAVVAEMGITGVNDYLARRKEDPRLYSDPRSYYRDEWKSWPVFLGKK